MKCIGLFTYKGYIVALRLDNHSIECRKLTIAASFKIGLADQVPFLYSNFETTVIMDDSLKYFSKDVVFQYKRSDDLVVLSNKGDLWKSQRIKVINGTALHKLGLKKITNTSYIDNLATAFGDKFCWE